MYKKLIVLLLIIVVGIILFIYPKSFKQTYKDVQVFENGKKVRTTGFYVSSPEDIDILKINKNNFYIKAKKDCMWQNNNLLSDHVYRITFDILDRSSNDGEEYFMSKHDIDKLNDSMNKLASDLKQAVLD